jgi:hypothetical protein
VRRRFHALIGGKKLHVTLDSDRFARSKPIVMNEALSELRFDVESENPNDHVARLELAGSAAGRYTVRVGGQIVRPTKEGSVFEVAVTGRSATVHVEIG